MKNFLKKYHHELTITLFLLIFMLYFVLSKNQFGFLSDRDSFEAFIESFGVLAPLAIIFVIVLEVILAPLPGFVPAISSGFIFGQIEGGIYLFIGNVIGTLLAFWIGRKWGKQVVLKLVKIEKIKKYTNIIKKHQNILLLAYFIPILPLDIISFAFGLSKIRFRKFILFACLGYLSYVAILSTFGDYLAQIYF